MASIPEGIFVACGCIKGGKGRGQCKKKDFDYTDEYCKCNDVVNSVEVFTLFIDVSRTPETSEIKYFVRLFNSFQTLANVTKNSILDAA